MQAVTQQPLTWGMEVLGPVWPRGLTVTETLARPDRHASGDSASDTGRADSDLDSHCDTVPRRQATLLSQPISQPVIPLKSEPTRPLSRQMAAAA
jgi:hypothetical protein